MVYPCTSPCPRFLFPCLFEVGLLLLLFNSKPHGRALTPPLSHMHKRYTLCTAEKSEQRPCVIYRGGKEDVHRASKGTAQTNKTTLCKEGHTHTHTHKHCYFCAFAVAGVSEKQKSGSPSTGLRSNCVKDGGGGEECDEDAADTEVDDDDDDDEDEWVVLGLLPLPASRFLEPLEVPLLLLARQRDENRHRCAHPGTQAHKQTQTQKDTSTQANTHTSKHTHTQAHAHAHRHTQTHRYTHKDKDKDMNERGCDHVQKHKMTQHTAVSLPHCANRWRCTATGLGVTVACRFAHQAPAQHTVLDLAPLQELRRLCPSDHAFQRSNQWLQALALQGRRACRHPACCCYCYCCWCCCC